MTIGKYLTGGAVAAIAAALALAATPAAAREARENMGRSWQPSSNSAKASERREARSADRSQPVRQAPQVRQPAVQRQQWNPLERQAPQVRQAPPQARGPLRQDPGVAQRDWSRGNDRSNRDAQRGTTWNRGSTATPPAIRSVPVPSRNTTYADGGRNRSYTDSDRNRSNDGRRDGGARAERRGDDRSRWADRRGDRWSDRQQDRRADRRNDRHDDRYAYNGGRRDGYRDNDRDHRRWDHRSWRNDHRYDWRDYRNSHRTVFRLGGYYAPYRNYSYRRLNIGFYLDSLFYADRYWINDPWNYRLPEVYGPYRWVRYYDDALLVDIYSGEVVDTIYDFFW